MADYRIETDGMGEVRVPADKLWGAQTQRSLQYFAIGKDCMPHEMIKAYAYIKKACALVNNRFGRLDSEKCALIVDVCEELLTNKYREQFPLKVWMTGSGTQFNMNVNEVIANRCSQLSDKPLGSKQPVHPNDHVNMAQSTNDNFPTAMHVAIAIAVQSLLLPQLVRLADLFIAKAEEWRDIIKIGRTHLQDATPLTFGQELSGYVCMLHDNKLRIEQALNDVYKLTLGGTAVGTGINTYPGYAMAVAGEIAALTQLPFVSAPNKFAYQGGHDALVALSASLKTLAVSLHKIANDIRLLGSGPRAGIGELYLPENEPGSSIMPGKVNPTQCEALSMVALQVMANDFAVTLGGAGGMLEMNVYKPLIINNIAQSINILSDAMRSFGDYCVAGMTVNTARVQKYVDESLMLVTALSPSIGYDKAARIAHHALHNDLTLRQAALENGVSEQQYDELVRAENMI